MTAKELGSTFFLGSHLCREPMPTMSEMKKDMEILKRHGFNLIKLQEHWMIDEPVEGRYDFSRYEELIEHAGKLDLDIYLGLTCEQAPRWLWRKHPDCCMVGRNGMPIVYQAQTTLPCDGKPGPCYDHPGAMADQLRFIRKLVEVLGRYDNLAVWNTWQEIGYWGESLAGQHVCYCPHTLAHYHRWLKLQYGDLDALNRAWGSRYSSWEDLIPEQIANRMPIAQEVCWRYFMDNVQVPAVLRARAKAIREADPRKRPVFAHKGAPMIASGQDWAYARSQDFLGSSCYPAWGCGQGWDDGQPTGGAPFDRHFALHTEMWDAMALRFDYIRCANPAGAPVWAAEFQGGPVSTGFHKGRVPSADDIRRWMLTAVGAGVTAISFWVTRAEIMAPECNGFSLLDSVGDDTPRLQEASRVGQALARHADLFAQPTRRQADVAILVNEWNFQLSTSLAQGGGNLGYSLRGWYRLLWDLGIPVDFLEAGQLKEEHSARYKAMILPFPLSMSESVAADLRRYVTGGGCLISEAAPGRISDHCQCNRGELSPTMAELFGVAQESFTMVREPNGGMRWSPQERTYGEYVDATVLTGEGILQGHQLRANVYLETFTCRGGEPILRSGPAVAGVIRNAGKGQAVLLGTYVGHNGTAYRDERTHAAVAALLERCGVESQKAGRLLLRKRQGEGQEAWLLTNTTPQDVTETLDVSGWASVEDLLDETISRQGNQLTLTVKSLDVRVLILKKA